MYTRKGVGQVQSALAAQPIVASSDSSSAIDCTTNPCTWFDMTFWPSDTCAAWYAQCQPNSAFNLMTTKGAVVGGTQVLGQTAGSAIAAAVEGTGEGLEQQTTVPSWVWIAGLGIMALAFLPELIKR